MHKTIHGPNNEGWWLVYEVFRRLFWREKAFDKKILLEKLRVFEYLGKHDLQMAYRELFL